MRRRFSRASFAGALERARDLDAALAEDALLDLDVLDRRALVGHAAPAS